MLRWLMLVLVLAALSGGWWLWHGKMGAGEGGEAVAKELVRVPDRERYEVLTADLKRWREELGGNYRQARNPDERAAVENDARVMLELILPEMMRCWLGTPWDFNGTAAKPGEDGVACGYFVSTVLRDAGFVVDRYRLAQQPSENILKSFLPSEKCFLVVGRDYEVYADEVEKMEHGVYLIGLDTHVGFIVNGPGGMRFLHSSGSRPWCVVDESREEAAVLRDSRWRMIGCLTGESSVMAGWLKGERVEVRTMRPRG